ncbi:Disintegrin and metalloproteinase domain-containing protein 9, partial [Coelomomyces lativittatus]
NVVKIHVLLYLSAFAQFLVCTPFVKIASTHGNDVEPLNFDNFTLPLFKRQEGKKKYEIHLLLVIDDVKKEDEENERGKAIKFISNINSIMRKTGLTTPLIQFKAVDIEFVDRPLIEEGGNLSEPFENWNREFAKVKKPEYHAGVQLIHNRAGKKIGQAVVGALCTRMASASISGYQPDTNGVFKTTFIHEIFHILGVNHDEDLGCSGSIMAGANLGSRKVSSCTNKVLEKRLPIFASQKNCIQLVDDDGSDDGSADADGDKFDTDSNDYNFDKTPGDEGGRYIVR